MPVFVDLEVTLQFFLNKFDFKLTLRHNQDVAHTAYNKSIYLPLQYAGKNDLFNNILKAPHKVQTVTFPPPTSTSAVSRSSDKRQTA